MEASRHFAFTERDPEFEIDEVFDRGDMPAREAQFESIQSDAGRSSSGVWPLMLALVVGIALGFGMAMLLLGRDRVPPAPQQAAASTGNTGRSAAEIRDEPIREVTEQTVATAPKPGPQAPAPVASAAPPPSVSPESSANAKPGAVKPTPMTPRPAAERPLNRGASAQAARPQTRPPVSATKTTPSKPAAPARSGPAPAPSRGVNRSEVPPPKPIPQTPAPKPRTGSLAIDSRPAGAAVYVDGRRVGSTPLVLGTLKVGEYTIGLDLDGYKRWATTVKVSEEERSRVAASLER